MSIRFATAGDFLDYSAGSPNTAAVTVTAWIYLSASTANPQEIIRIRSSADGTVLAFKAIDVGASLRLGGPATSFDSSVSVPGGVWTAVACTVSGTAGVIYQKDATRSVPTVTSGTIDTGTGAKYSVGGRGGSDTGENFNGRIAAVKIFQRVLTLDEIVAEWARTVPVKTAGLYAAYPLDSGRSDGVLDYSGNGRALLQGSNLTGDPPPIPRRRTPLVGAWLEAPGNTISTVGTLVNSFVTSSQSTVSLTTVNVGDCVVAELTVLANIQITGVSSPHVTWREVAGPLYNSTLVATTHKWVGTVTAVSTANVTLTFSAAIGSNVLQRTITQLTAGLGSSCQWFSFAGSQTNASSTTMAYPPLSATYANLGYTPAGGAPIAYVGYALGLNAGSAGSTPGFTYTLDTIVAPLAVDTNVALNSTPAPTASQSPAAVSYSTAVLLMPVLIAAPGGDFDLTNWYLTLPTDDGSGGAATVHQPSLNTYTDTNFNLDGSGRMVMTAPVNGFTTSGSTATRSELREQQGGSNAAWDMSTTTRSLTVSGFYDATSITGGSNPRQEQIIGQIHSTGGTPPLYLSMNFSTTPTELQVFQDTNGSIGNLITGFTSSTRIAYRIEVVGGNVNVYGVAGDETALPGTPQFSLPHTGFTETTGCYFKAGSYNKTDTGTGATGQAVATVAYLGLLQGPAVSVSDTVGLSDVVTRAAQSRTRTVADTFGAADVVSGRVRSVSDTVTLPDAVTRSMSRWQRGINDAGGEFGDPADGGTLPGVYGVDYQYDSAATLTYLAGRGHTIVRLPFLWERIQPTLGGALDPTELGRLQAYVSRAGTAGVRVILDVHNYARYSPPPGSTTYVLGDGNLSQTHIADLWQRLSAAFKGNPGIAGYGLMNEPHDVLAVAGTYSGTVRYNWDDGTVQGWTGDTATATNVSNKLRLTGTATAGGFWDMRKDDNGTVSGGNTPAGNVLTATVTLAASSPAGTWQCLLQWQTGGPSFQWVTTSSNVYVRTDTGATVAALVPGVAVQVYAVFSSNIVNPNKFAIQIQSSNPSAGTVTADIDNYSQGTLSGYVSTVQQWEQTAQACVTAIRGNGDNTMVMVSTYPWAEPNAAAVHPTAWIVDPAGAGLVRYEGHIYFDDDISGRYLNSFAAETSLAAGEGYPSVQARTAARLSQFTAWLSNHGVLGYLGEVGWPNGTDAASWNAVGAAFYSALANLDVWVTYWSTGEGWGTSSSTYPMVAYMQAGSGLPVSVANAQASTIEALPSTGITRSVADSLGLSDVTGRAALQRTVSDTVGVVDGGSTSSNVLYTFDSTTQGWSGESSATATQTTSASHDGAGSLHISATVAAGAGQIVRANDNNNNTAVESAGNTLSVWCFIPVTTPGTTWRANIELQDSSFSYHNGTDVAVTKGVWTQLTYTPSDTVWTGHKAIAVQFTVDDATGTTCDLYIDTVAQVKSGSLPRTQSFTRSFADTVGLSDVVAGPASAVSRSFATIGATTSAQVAAVAAAGLTHNVVVAFWDQLQPSGAGTALDSTALASLNATIGYNISNGLKTILEHALHYPPAWVLSAVEPFKDQGGNVWSGTSGNGDQVRNWMWTSLGRTYVADFLSKVYAGLTSTNRAAVDRIRFGGGVFGELHYPTAAVSSPYSYWAFGASMQTGTGLATGLTAAPDASYTPFTGTTTQDNNFIAWYIGGITNWMTWYAGQLASAGWTCDLMCLHPGYGIRSNQVHTDAGFRQALSCGEDPATVIAAYASNAQVWPWCTWIDGADGWVTPSVDSDQAAWKKVFAEAYKWGKHTRIWGENTGGESNAGMGLVFHNALSKNLSPITGDPIYPSGTTAPGVYPGYVGLMWLNYSSLTSGGSNATLANYQGLITHAWPTIYWRGVNDSGGEFGSGSIPGTYNTDYHYDSSASLTYLAGRGHKLVRFPFLWERIQHTLNSALDSTELTRIQTYVSNAHAAGLKVVLDVHNFARYSLSGTTHVLGDGTLTQAAFADLWSRLSVAFAGNTGIAGYGLMNEPHDLTGTSGSYTANSTLYNFDASVQGWVEETGTGTVADQAAVVHDGANALQVTKTVSSGSPTIRCNDAAGNTATIAGGQTIAAWVQLASGTAGTWTAHMEMQNSGFSWQAGSDFTLTAGTWTQLTYTPSSTIWAGHHGIGIQFTGAGISGTPGVTVYVDTVSQGTLTGSLSAAQVWEQAAQAAVTAIRVNDTTTPIMVGGYGFSSADNWPTNHPTAFITDPNNSTYYEAHLYYDNDASGVYANSYATELTNANSGSYKDPAARARTRLSHFTDWCATQNVKGFIGETGWPNGSDAANWNTVGAAVYTDADRAGLWVTYWAVGEWYGTTYALSAYEQVGSAIDTANAQAPTIEAHPSVLGGTSLTATDVVSLSDTMSRAAQSRARTVTDTVGLADSVTRASRSLTRAVADTVGLSGAVTRAAQVFTRTLSSAVYPSSSLFPSSTLFPGTGGPDTVGLSDVQTRAALNLAHNLADAVGAADSIARAPQTVGRSLPDTAGLADTVGRSPQSFTRSAADTMGVSDVAARSAQPRSRTISDTAGLSDTLIRGAQAFTRSLSNAVYPGLSLFPGSTQFPESEFDTVGLSDVQVRAAPGSGRTTSDTVGLSDAVTRTAQVLTRTLVDVVPAIDTVILGLVFSVADRIGLADTQTRAPRTFTAALSDSAGLADSQGRSTQAFARALPDMVGVFDSQGRPAQSFTRTVADTLGFVDTQGRAGQPLARSITDALRLVDVKSRTGQAFSRSFADVLGFVDNQARAALNLARAISGALGLSDAALQGRVFVRAIADGMGLSDSQASSARLSIRAVADAAGLVDTQSVLSSSGLTTTDSAGLVDAAAAHGIASRSVLDGVAATDVVAAAEHLTRAAVDAFGLLDSVAKRTGATSAVDKLRLVDETTAHLVVLPLGIGIPAVVGVLATGLGPDGANAPYIAY